MKKADEQGIHSAKLSIGNYLKMSNSLVRGRYPIKASNVFDLSVEETLIEDE
ncbi:tRNA (guanine(9)-N1)-methyltransferase isoform X2 [Canna indica]|uniref:tRNA (Guanine(9)-N1)-methyltransferase isoform X2 n=1 Tax=Canna indica TaxID=4628 RepID=A0AAQ3KW29_9LILI|nr:tRNA (guanine(9)-N1)-methyltransferase isoform X2 [Canna indica]